MLQRFDGLFGDPMPYILAFQQAPVRQDRELAHLHVELTSPRRAESKLKRARAALVAAESDVKAGVLGRARQGSEVTTLLTRLAPMIALTAVSLSVGGLFVMRRAADSARWPMLAGTAVALLALTAQGIALVLGWPATVGIIVIFAEACACMKAARAS